MYSVSLHKRAAKYYETLDVPKSRRINKAVEEIIKNPTVGKHIRMISGKLKGHYRYAIGDLRIIYRVYQDEKIVFIEAIGPRGDIYK